MTDKEIQHPSSIIKAYDELFKQAKLNPQESCALGQLVAHTLPYPNRESLQVCADAFLATESTTQFIDKDLLKDALNHFFEQPFWVNDGSTYKTTYPLAAAIKILCKKCEHNPDLPDLLNLLIELGQYSESFSKGFDLSTYYTHIRSIRDVLVFVHYHYEILTLNECKHPIDSIKQLNDQISECSVDALLVKGIAINKTPNIKQKLLTTLRIYDGDIKLGHKMRERHSSPAALSDAEPSTKSKFTPRRPTTASETLFSSEVPLTLKLVDHQRKQVTIKSNHRPKDTDTPVLTRLDFARKHRLITDESVIDSNAIETLDIVIPNALTTSHEKHIHIQRKVNVYAANNVVSQSDMQRISYQQVAEQLILIDRMGSPLLVIFTYLSFSTGFETERLGNVKISNERPIGDEVIVNYQH